MAVAATCKHYFAYSFESADGQTRHNFNAILSQRDIQETYLAAFQKCLLEGDPAQVMCSYNAINGYVFMY